MPNWGEILKEIAAAGSVHDQVRRKYLRTLHEATGRNVIIYYSGWLQKPGFPRFELNDADKTGFMTAVHRLDRAKGLDLVLHTPGGDTAATESLVDYLRSMFGTNMRAIVPQLAMSSGTMIACACKSIVMGKQSSLGPIDPQFGGRPAHGIVEEFKRAYEDIRRDNVKAAVWQPVIAKYSPTLIGECEKAIEWCNSMVRDWLQTGMFEGNPSAAQAVDKVMEELADHAISLSHARHLSMERCRRIGLKIDALEDEPKLQDAVLSVHHACIHTLTATAAIKIIENHEGAAFIQAVPVPARSK